MKLRRYRVAYPYWAIRVEARGYQDMVGSFADYERGDGRFHVPEVPPPPVVLRLHRETRSAPTPAAGGRHDPMVRPGE